MEIEEWQPTPSPPQSSEPKRKYRSAVLVGVFLVVVFIGTLAILAWRETTEYAQKLTKAPALPSVIAAMPGTPAPLAGFASGKLSQDTKRAVACISDGALSAAELHELTEVLKSQPELAESSTTADFHSAWAADFFGRLSLVQGELGEKARAAFRQSIANGQCKQ